jgi:hypothetical protein
MYLPKTVVVEINKERGEPLILNATIKHKVTDEVQFVTQNQILISAHLHPHPNKLNSIHHLSILMNDAQIKL